jgi:SPP1 family predicted phage head-tail adaptor
MGTPAGKYRYRIIIQEMRDEPNGLGEVVPVPHDRLPVWARVEALMAREYLAADRTKSSVSYKVTMRSLAWLTTKHRLLWNGRILNIQSVLYRGERMEEQEMFCAEEID